MVKVAFVEPPALIHKGLVICREKRKNHPFGIFYGENPLDYSFPLLLLEVSSFIIISRLISFLLKPLKQPKIVAKILGGIVLGPSLLSRSEKFHAYMFPDTADFVLQNIGVIGFMYFLFLSGVKMDVTQIKRLSKKHWYIAVIGVVVPLSCSATIAVLEIKSFNKEMAKGSSIWGITASLAMTSFPVLYPIVRELNLLGSEIGRMALSTAIISDVIGMNGVLIFEASKQAEYRAISALWYMISLIVVAASVIWGFRQAMIWIIRTTPEGQQVDQFYIVLILLGVMIAGFITDMFGLAIANGPFWLGLAIPDGPPLGATVVEKSETIVIELLMPFSFMYVGMITDVFTLSGQWSHLKPIFLMILAGYIIKTVSTLIASRFFDMTIRDSLTLSLISSLRGEMELLLFLHWMSFKMIDQSEFTIMVLLTLSVTAILTPLISILYDPTKPYMVNTRRNIQHTSPNTELHVVVCIHSGESLPGLVKVLEVSNPNVSSPLSVYALCLVELVGRSHPMFIDHENTEHIASSAHYNSIHNALKISQQARGNEHIKIHSYTMIAPIRCMYQDICGLALSKKACLIILPLHRQALHDVDGTMRKHSQSMNCNVLTHAPCSVGILLDKGPYENIVNGVFMSLHRLIVLFLGGADAREALTYADRMATNQETFLTVIRFLSHENMGDNDMEKKLDDGLVTWFWVKNEGNSRVIYREVVVKNGEETIAAIQALNKDIFDLWIVGRKHGVNPVILQGFSSWSESNELGVIGEYVASEDFGSTASVLVIQQQILREEEYSSSSLLGRLCIR
ncbi:cation/H(+) antiporter 24-like [Primulina tabacum]|uniref:cation/H(+) antiporter 24-like n=1 Tax=Primulina tabacum TaxID=48773 RepID=UPI003F5A132B